MVNTVRSMVLSIAAIALGSVAHAQDPAAVPTPSAETPPAAAPTSATPADEPEVEPDPLRLDSRPVTSNIQFRPGRGLRIQSEDEQFQLNIRLRGQVLYTYEQPNDATEGEHALELRRARLAFNGHWWGEDNRFKIELAFAPRDQFTRDNITAGAPATSLLLDWFVDFTQLRDLNVRVGQFKVNFNRERVISSADIPLVDRSIVNAEFNIDRDVGVELYSRDLFGLERLRYTAGLYIGRGRNAVGFHPRDSFMALGRVEFHPFGTFEDLNYVDFERSSEARLAIGVSGAFIPHAHRNLGILGTSSNGTVPDGVDLATRHFATDALFLFKGISLSSEFLLRDGEQSGTPSDPAVTWGAPRNGWGLYGEVGYLLPAVDLSVNARFSVIRPFGDLLDRTTTTTLGSRNEAGFGATYFVGQHAFKIQADYFYLWTEDQPEAGDHRVRAQLQVAL